MNDKDLYRKKRQAQLDEWTAEVDKLKARAARASAEAQLAMNKKASMIEVKIDAARTRLAELEEASDEAWDSMKDGVESAWTSLKTAVHDAVGAFKD